jgi:hypothetical protein
LQYVAPRFLVLSLFFLCSFFVLSLLFLCFASRLRFVSLSFVSHYPRSKSDIFPTFFRCLFVAFALILSRFFLGSRARLNHQFALSVSFDALPNRSRNFYDRADKLRQATTRLCYARTAHGIGNRP